MRWLHLSDLHMGRPAPSPQTTALGSLLQAIEVALEDRPVDAILLTGDLAYSGLTIEYKNLTESVLTPLRALRACSSAQVIALPGNHDLDCNVTFPLSWDALGARRQMLFFAESAEGIQLREPRVRSFEAFRAWVRENGIIAPDPGKEVSRLFRLVVGTRTILFACTNTSWFSDKEVSDREKAPSPEPSLRAVLQNEPKADQTIILGHHPIDWFSYPTRNPFKSLLGAFRAFYLHGHTHQIDAKFGPHGLEGSGCPTDRITAHAAMASSVVFGTSAGFGASTGFV
jgi:predicted MPP superfamily phosphohydrolase